MNALVRMLAAVALMAARVALQRKPQPVARLGLRSRANGPGRSVVARALDRAVVQRDGVPVVDVADVDRLSDIDRDRPLPLEALGRSRLPDGDYVAYALNGTVATVAEVHEDPRADRALVLGLLRPDLFVDGENVLSAYLVDGEPGSEVLRPLSLADAR